MNGVPDIGQLPEQPILQALASKSAWIRVVFYKEDGVTKDEIYRTMELLAMMYNGWDDTPLPKTEKLPEL